MRQGLKVIGHFVPKGRAQAGPDLGVGRQTRIIGALGMQKISLGFSHPPKFCETLVLPLVKLTPSASAPSDEPLAWGEED